MAPKFVTQVVGGRYESVVTETFCRTVKIDFCCTGYGKTKKEAEEDALRRLNADPYYKKLSTNN